MTGAPIVLYDTPGSPCARRVRMTLIEKGLPFERVILDLARMDNKAEWYLRINPNGQVPAIRIGERTLYESNVITEYLDAIFPEPRLYPDDPDEYAQVKYWQTFEAIVSKHYGLLQYARLLGPLSRIQYRFDDFMAEAHKRTREPALLQWEARVWRGEVLTAEQERAYSQTLYGRLDELESALTGRTFLVGERFSQAEISVYPRIAMYPYLGLTIDPLRYPGVSAWLHRLRHRPAFTRSATLVDRIMSRPGSARLIAWADPKNRAGGSLTRRLGLQIARGILSQDIMRVQRDIDRVRRFGARVVRRNRVAAPLPLASPVPRPAAVAPGPWQVHGCPFNSETRIVVATLMAAEAEFDFHPVMTPLAEEFGTAYRALAGLPEVPHVVCARGVVRGWPYVLACIAEHRGPSALYPDDPWTRARVQIGCIGDSVVNFKYKRPLHWQRIVGPWLRARLPGVAAMLKHSASSDAEPATRELIFGAWTGSLVDAAAADACVGLLVQRARLIGRTCSRDRWLAGAAFTLADIAEWVRLEESVDLGLSLDDSDSELRAAAVWRDRIAEMPFARRWRRWLSDSLISFATAAPRTPLPPPSPHLSLDTPRA